MSSVPVRLAFRSRSFARGISGALCLSALLVGGGCSGGDAETTAAAAGGSATDSATVYWPELVTFDDIALRAEGRAKALDLDAVNAMLPELLEAGQAVTIETIPSNVKDRPLVDSILGDLTNLVDGLVADASTAPTIVVGIHSVTARLMYAAGMPHVHASEGPNQGLLNPVFGAADGKQVGTAEVRLDAETGHLQVWLTRGGRGGEPWLLPVDTTLELSFPILERSVTLAVQASEADAETTSTFVFPGEADADTSWLTGIQFMEAAEMRFTDATTASFVLRPAGS